MRTAQHSCGQRSILHALGQRCGGKQGNWHGGGKRRRARRFFFEPLEERALLAICIWEGGGSDSRWSDAANWAGGLVPGIDDDLVFRGAAVTQTENDLPAGTAFGSLSFLSSDFSIAGNSLGVSNRIFVGPQASGATIAAEVALNGAVLATIVGGPLSFSGGVSGSGSLTENGNGVLVLASTATFTGSTTIHSGATLQLGSPAALPGRRDAGPVKINGALDLAGYNATVEGLSGRGLVTTSVPGLTPVRSRASSKTDPGRWP